MPITKNLIRREAQLWIIRVLEARLGRAEETVLLGGAPDETPEELQAIQSELKRLRKHYGFRTN